MAGRKPKPPDPPWEILLEEMRSQSRATIEAVELMRETHERRFDSLDQRVDRLDQRIDRLDQGIHRLDQETRTRDTALELAVRAIQGELRDLASRVEVRPRLEERVTAIEKRLG